MEDRKLITLNYVKKNIYDVGEKIDFVLTKDFRNDKFKGTIIAISDYEYANKTDNIMEKWIKPYEVVGITEEMLEKEPFYKIELHEDFNEYKRGSLIVVCQLFIDEDLTKDAEDETFAIYVEMNLQSNHEEYEVKQDVIDAVNEFLNEKGLNPSIRLLKEYDDKDVFSILESLKYYIKIDREDPEVEKSVINLLRGATDKEIIENFLHSRRYEVRFSKLDPRTVICTPLIKFNRKDITFKY